jgi:hypothetical protein
VVNEKSDGWPYWGGMVAETLMGLIHQTNSRNVNYWKGATTIRPSEAEIRAAVSSIKAFATKHGLTVPDLELPPGARVTTPKPAAPPPEAPDPAHRAKLEAEAVELRRLLPSD